MNLEPLNDGGTARTITFSGNGNVNLNSAATSLVAGTQIAVAVGQAVPVSDYKFAEGSGTTALDSGSNQLNGTLVGSGVAYTSTAKTGPFALNFTSANSYVQIPNSSLDQITGSFTVSAWVNASAFQHQFHDLLDSQQWRVRNRHSDYRGGDPRRHRHR